MARIERATAADAEEAGEVLARAFLDDPAMLWVFPHADRLARLARLYTAIVRFEGVPAGTVLVARDTAARALGAAVWRRRAGRRLPSWRDVAFGLSAGAALGSNMGRMIALGRAVGRGHPRQPHWYLQLLGIDPAVQRGGIGSALVRAQLAVCDAEGLPAYLETTEENLGFYARFGFEVVGDIHIAPGAPAQYGLWREPAAGV